MGYFSIAIGFSILVYCSFKNITVFIALRVFERAGIPKKYIMGAITGGAFTFALSGPGSPQLTNVAGMYLGTSSTSGLVAGICAIVVEIIIMVVILSRMALYANAHGEGFTDSSGDMAISKDTKHPGFMIFILPLLCLLILFNVFKVNVIISTMLSCVVSIALFYKYMSKDELLNSMGEGATAKCL